MMVTAYKSTYVTIQKTTVWTLTTVKISILKIFYFTQFKNYLGSWYICNIYKQQVQIVLNVMYTFCWEAE
jgi:hypothetical protein